MSEKTSEDSPLSSSNNLENAPLNGDSATDKHSVETKSDVGLVWGFNVDLHKKATEEETEHSVETKPDVGLVSAMTYDSNVDLLKNAKEEDIGQPIAEAIAPVTHDNNVDNQPLQTIEGVGQAASVICANVDEKLHLDTTHDDGKTVPETSDRNVDKTDHDKTEDVVQMKTSDIKTLTKHSEIFTADIESQRALALEIEKVREDLYYKDQDYKKEKLKVEHRQQRNKTLRTKNEKLKDEINDMKQRETDLQQSFNAKEVGFEEEFSRLQQIFQESEENVKTFKQMLQESEENLTRLREKQGQLEVINNQLAEENISLTAKVQQLESKVSCIPVLQKEIEEQKQLYTQAREEHYNAKEEVVKQWNDYVVKLVKDQEAEVKKLQKELGDNKKKVTNLTEEKTKLKATLDKKDEENKKHVVSAKNALKHHEDARREFEARKSNFEKQIKTLHGEKYTSEKLASERKNIIEQKEREIWQYQQHIQQLQTDLNNHITTIKSLEKDKKDLTLRLSKLAGANLTYNNPNIADLSDENRPTKLAEEFSELYDNEWTDAFEVVEIKNEKEKTEFMLNILKQVSNLCHDTSRNHMEAIKKSLSTLVIQDLWEEEEEPVEEVIRIEAALQNDDQNKHQNDHQGRPDTSPEITDQSKTNAEVPAISGSQTSMKSNAGDNTNQEVNTEKQENQVSCDIFTQNKEEEITQSIEEEKTLSKEKEKPQSKEELKTESLEEKKNQSDEEAKPQRKKEDKSKSKEEEKSHRKEEEKPQSKKEEKSQSTEEEKPPIKAEGNTQSLEEKTQSKAEEKSQNKEELKPERKKEDKGQSMKEENPQSKEEEKPQSKKEEKSQSKEEKKPHIKAAENIQSLEEEKTKSKEEESIQRKVEEKPKSIEKEKIQSKVDEKPHSIKEDKIQSKIEDKPQNIEEENTQNKVEEKPQSLKIENIQNKVEEKPQSMEEKKIKRMEIEKTEQIRTNVKGGLTNVNQASHEPNMTNVDNNADHADGENCEHQTEKKVVGAGSTADKNMTEQIKDVLEREDEHESSHPESEKADKDIHPNGDNGVQNEISKLPDDNENKSKDFQKSESTKRCSRKTQTYFKTLSTNFDQLTNEQKKTILDIRKLFENQMSKDFHKAGQDILAKEIGIEKQPHEFIDIYIAKCIKICWSMCRHEPPVHIHFPKIEWDLPYDTNMYKPYTKTGKHLDFVVWPALYLHENGPMLAKGVAQGRK